MAITLLSYNLNGIRSVMNKGFGDWFSQEQPDIMCFQEIKAQADQINSDFFHQLGYETFWYPAQKKGYSGTGIVTRIKPDKVIDGMGVEQYDHEGRVIRMDFGDVTLICTYFPSGTTGEVRQAVKMNFLSDFTKYIHQLQNERPKIIIGGDLNICHKPIDINFPKKHVKMSGFLPEERQWFDQFIDSGFIDTFREFNQEPEQYTWWSNRSNAREKNLGWRIDYFLTSQSMKPQLKGADILDQVVFSDHCPISLSIEQ